MSQEHKTVFISYRREPSSFIARAVYQDLRSNGYDAFMDVESIDSGQFDTIILRQIEARAHFIIILTPGSLERCAEPGDWLRREIEHAMDHERNIVPLLCNNFSYGQSKQYLTGKLAELPRFNGLNVPHDFFEEAMVRLRSRYLKQPVYGIVRPAPADDEETVVRKVAQADATPLPTPQDLSAEEYFNLGAALDNNSDEEHEFYTKAIRLKPDYAAAFFNRGIVRKAQGNIEGAIADYTEAIRHQPDYAAAYNNRGVAHDDVGEVDKALADYDSAIQHQPDYAMAYFNRGLIYANKKSNPEQALADYSKAIELNPEYSAAYYSRGKLRREQDDLHNALNDYDAAIRYNPADADAYNGRGLVKRALGELDSAVEDFNTALELNPNMAFAYNNRGLARSAQGDHAGAIEDYNKAIELNPNYDTVYNNRGIARKTLGDHNGAIADYTKAIELDPTDALYYYNRGISRRDAGYNDGAIADYTYAIQLFPEYINAYYNRAVARRGSGDLRGAIDDYQRYLDLGGGVRDGDQAEVEQRIRDLRKELGE